MASAWQKWLDASMDHLRALLANDLPGDAVGSAEERNKTRQLLKVIAATVEGGDAAAWRRLAVAFDVVDVGGSLDDREPNADKQIDSTMPAVQYTANPHASAPHGSDPLSHSVDETVALGVLSGLNLDEPTERDPRSPPGSTLMTGHPPVQGHQRTVPIPVHMPAGVTASGTPSSAQVSGGTTPITRVPSSVLDIEKYAVLCAWTEVHPNKRTQLHAQYGLQDESERRDLDARFEALFTQNLQLRSAFEKRLQMHLGFLRRT